MKSYSRSGSALLIVLGMLSFMVVSAIGFSVFMRQNRIPSSFVRRNTTSHQLLKAALARAMNEIDSAIGEDPFPGIDNNNETKYIRGSRPAKYIDDTWKGRVFVGKVRNNRTTVNTDSQNVLISDDNTVSTLSMEALAYLPPCLVNDVRYFSRHTPTAEWQMLAYDAGRYAYTAVNVSDYFDINNVPFAEPRTYSPSNRVSLAYLFRSGSGAPDPRQAERFSKDIVEKNHPFVSLADFNLVMFNQVGGASAQSKYGFASPFGDYASGNGAFLSYYRGVDTNVVAKTTFVTDSYFPEEDIDETLLDLNDEACQPFDSAFLSGKKNIFEIYREATSSDFAKALSESKHFKLGLSGPTWANLYDYLDANSLPVSLAIPSVEQVPVVAGFEVKGLNDIKIVAKREVLDGGFDPAVANEKAEPGNKVFKIKYTLDIENNKNLDIDVTTLFPFNKAQCSGFEVEAAAHLFWGPTGGGSAERGKCGPMNMRGSVNSQKVDDYVVTGLLTEKGASEDGGMDDFNRYTFKSKSAAISSSGYAELPEDALNKTSVSLDSGSRASTKPFAVLEETWNYVYDKKSDSGTWNYVGANLLNDEGMGLVDANHLKTTASQTYKPYLAFRVLTRNSEGVVDMAPACGWDDVHNYGSVAQQSSAFLDMNRSAFIVDTTGFELNYSVDGIHSLTAEGARFGVDPVKNPKFAIASATKVCKDPKWNHNVFNWTTVARSIKDDIIDTFKGEGKDGDFFQSVSDAEWLQSIAELALLPRTTVFKTNVDVPTGTLRSGTDDDANFAMSLPLTKKIATGGSRGETVYLCASMDGDDNCLESLFADGSGGFRINPYSDDENIFLAALAFTPYDWYSASSDNEFDFNTAIKNTFSESSDVPSARLQWREIQEIARKMQEKFADYDDWIEAYNELGWGLSAGNDIFQNTDLTSADKKYLYGFWKGCFANRQQLFILFLRAEPTVSGGGAGAGQGARAVAVVWRDPNPPKKPNGDYYDERDQAAPPHKMRVLFYKALE